MMKAFARLAIAVAGTLILSPAPANAHPHVWISASSDVVFNDDGKVIAIDVTWVFDEFYSLTAVEGMDTDGNGGYDGDELQPLAQENITALQEYGYFTAITSGSDEVKPGVVTQYQSTYKDGELSLIFRVPLTEPLDPKKAKVSYRMYDPSFYIAIEYAPKDPVSAFGAMPKECTVKVTAADGDSDDVDISEQAFVDALQTEGLGGLYAETATVVCTDEPAS